MWGSPVDNVEVRQLSNNKIKNNFLEPRTTRLSFFMQQPFGRGTGEEHQRFGDAFERVEEIRSIPTLQNSPTSYPRYARCRWCQGQWQGRLWCARLRGGLRRTEAQRTNSRKGTCVRLRVQQAGEMVRTVFCFTCFLSFLYVVLLHIDKKVMHESTYTHKMFFPLLPC